ncbi:hypothetical protein Asp14428_05410 [Actinoplanes sp. NBRC 14428]|nr:hypothetical protein Asp14428_05410 [Actinoplanes sp. NBRC 14428]
MLLTLVLTVALIGACVSVLWPWNGVEPDDKGEPAAPVREPETLEGALVSQLAAGEISRGQYARAMERLAARDDERHPLAVPPDNGPAGAGA